MISVMINNTGQNKTPAVRLNEKSFPKIFRWAGLAPKVYSSENNFTPISSAISALAIKKPPRIINNREGLFLMIVWIIQVKNKKD